jgi:putative ABC transport system ATP-binding protein
MEKLIPLSLEIETPSSECVIQLEKISKVYFDTRTRVVFSNVNLSINKGEFIAVVGPVGSGKTTLLNLIAGFDRPTSGKIWIQGLESNNIKNINSFRAKTVGFVHQTQNLIPELTVSENIALPLEILGIKKDECNEKINRILDNLVLCEMSKRKVSTLSVGESQLVSIARALASDPPIIIMDEPTESLDPFVSNMVVSFLKGNHILKNKTLIVATHDRQLKDIAKRVIRIKKKIP